jgi:hypothetical protein
MLRKRDGKVMWPRAADRNVDILSRIPAMRQQLKVNEKETYFCICYVLAALLLPSSTHSPDDGSSNDLRNVGKLQGYALMLEAAVTSETSVNFYVTNRCVVPGVCRPHTALLENLNTHDFCVVL